MKKLSAIVAVAFVVGSLSLAADSKKQTVSGHLIDSACQTEESSAAKPKPDYAVTHDKSCLLMPDCVGSGYGVLTADKRYIRFDKNGNDAAKKLIESTDKKNDWRVSVTGVLDGDNIAVDTIVLQK